jgi:2-oxoglutarate/2-oxoacid ferredoxin oxidoreductase subunit beta
MSDNITREDIIKPENLVYRRTPLMVDRALSYCPGCGHGVVHRLIMEVLEELNAQADTIGVAPVGCSVLAYEFLDIDMIQAAHGRAPALATAIKRLNPDKYVFHVSGRRRPGSDRHGRDHSCLQPG